MHLSTFAAFVVLGACVDAAPSRNTHRLHEKRSTEHSSLIKRTRVSEDAVLPVRIGLTQQNLAKGHDWVMDVSDPSSPNFGKFWTAEQVNAAFMPVEETAKAVVEWLVNENIALHRITESHNKGWIAFNATTQEAEKLFHTQFFEHEDSKTGRISVACDEYYLPHHIADHVDYVRPGVMPVKSQKISIPVGKGKRGYAHHWNGPPRPMHTYPKPPSPWEWQHQHGGSGPLPADLQNCSTYITPPCVFAMYDIPPQSNDVSSSNSLGIFEEGDYYAQEDLNDYFTTFLPQIPNGTHPIPALIDGAVAPVPLADAGGESELDLTTAYSIIYPQTITLYQTDDPVYAAEALNGTIDGFFDTFLDGIDGSFCSYSAYGQTGDSSIDPVYPDPQAGGYKGPLQCGKYTPTNVISVSYLFGEASLPVNYQERQCNEWMKLALQGHTILFASGDYGVASFPDDEYLNGTCIGPENKIFQPEGPSTCPWVTGVGATELSGDVYSEQVAAYRLFGDGALFTSSGGFSNIFAIPSYQSAAVAQYFEVENPPYPYYETLQAKDIGANGGLYNRIGRGFPDISAIGLWWLDFVEGEEGGWGGTSMATPIVASMLNRIIDERIKIGKSGPIGFLNTHIYSNPQLLTDITSGHNFGCGTDGFNTAPGWDPVTGMGTPKFPEMLEYFLSLP